MARQALLIREAAPGDVDGLIRLFTEAGNGAENPAGLVEEAPTAIAHMAASPDERLLVAEQEDQLVAAMHLRRGPISPLHSDSVIHTSFLLVLPDFRRHGCAHALLEAAVAWAEEKDVAHITAVTGSNSRETNRFLARLGLSTVATVRAVPTASLRKRLMAARRHPAPSGRHLGTVLAQRRSMRRRESPES